MDWEDLNALNDSEKASIALKRTQAFTMYVEGGGAQLMAPMDFLTLVMGFDGETVVNVLDNLDKFLKENKPSDAEDDLVPGRPIPEPKPPETFLAPNGAGDSTKKVQGSKQKVTARGTKASDSWGK